MITPRFTLKQDESYVYILIELKYADIENAEFEISEEDNTFIFHLHPFFLRLTFPGGLDPSPEAINK